MTVETEIIALEQAVSQLEATVVQARLALDRAAANAANLVRQQVAASATGAAQSEQVAASAAALAIEARNAVYLSAGSAGYYATVAAGVAAVSNGATFWTVVGQDRVDYQKVSGAAVELSRLPLSARVASAIAPTGDVLARSTASGYLDPAWLPQMEAMVPAASVAPPGWWKTGATVTASDGPRHIITNWSLHRMAPSFWARGFDPANF